MERKFNKTESSSPQLPDQLVKLLWKIGQSRSVHHECIVKFSRSESEGIGPLSSHSCDCSDSGAKVCTQPSVRDLVRSVLPLQREILFFIFISMIIYANAIIAS